MLKINYSVALMLAVGGCGGATAANNTDEPETISSLGGAAFTSVTTHRMTGGAPNTKASGTAAGAAYASTRAKTTGGAPTSAIATQGFAGGSSSKTSSTKVSAAGGSSAGQSTGGTGRVAAAGAFGAGGSTGGTGRVAAAGAFGAGGSTGGTGDCIPVCNLYGAPCCLWQTACLGPRKGCTIDVLAASANITYEYAELESKVAGLPQDISASITTQDIAWAAADPWPAGRIELHLTNDAATRYAAVLDSAKDGRVFRVSCADQSLFVGVFYLIYGAAALNTPVMHFARENGVSVLRLGAYQSAWMRGPSTTDCTTACQRIDRIEMHADLCRRGVMHELDPDAAPLNP